VPVQSLTVSLRPVRLFVTHFQRPLLKMFGHPLHPCTSKRSLKTLSAPGFFRQPYLLN